MRDTSRGIFSAAFIALGIVSSLLLSPSAALAYNENTTTVPPISEANCGGCHQPYFSIGAGVHGGYTTTTKKCKQCHTVHAAPASGVKLLPSATIKGVCLTCHDGTGGKGVYSAIVARIPAATPAGHRIDTTSTVPGGNAGTGGSATMTFEGVGGTLTCSDCHSPHASKVVDVFVGDRMRDSGIPQPLPTTKLLRQSPGGAAVTVTKYGSDWCLACHKGRVSGGAVHNHPADSTATHADPFYYARVSLVATSGVATATTVIGQMGGVRTPIDSSIPGGNRGYLMVYPRTAQQAGHKPICQQCHEDSRSVGSLVSNGTQALVTTATITNPDGNTASDNPRFQNFPHETVNARMLVELDDDLCLNCHPVAALP